MFNRFERGGDLYRKLGVGKIALIDKWFSDLGISSDKYTIDKDFNINVYGDLDLSGTKITSLPNNLNVGRGLFLEGTKITSLPDDLSVGGKIWLSKDRKGKIYISEHLKKKVHYES